MSDIRSHFGLFADRYRPPAEFCVFLPGGEALVFRGIGSATELEASRAELTKTVTVVRKAPSPLHLPYVGESESVWIKAFRLADTMLGFHAASEVVDGSRVPIGERLPGFSQVEMLEFAATLAPTFENVEWDWEMAQYRALGVAQVQEVADAKND